LFQWLGNLKKCWSAIADITLMFPYAWCSSSRTTFNKYAFRRHESMWNYWFHFVFLHVVQERISKVIEICRVCLRNSEFHPFWFIVLADRRALWVYPAHHLHWIYEEQPSTITNQVRTREVFYLVYVVDPLSSVSQVD
jgi:hypothetical protein